MLLGQRSLYFVLFSEVLARARLCCRGASSRSCPEARRATNVGLRGGQRTR